MIDITIAVVAYVNYEEVIELVKSIEMHTDKKITKKIFIIDNSSDKTDNSQKAQLVDSIGVYEDVEYVNINDNLGFGKGHNSIIPLLNSKYHAIVNPDIVLQEDSFSKIIEFMDTSSAGLCIPHMVDEHGTRLDVYRRELTVFDVFVRFFCSNHFKRRQRWHTMQSSNYDKPFRVPFGQGSFLVIRTELFKEISGFDERFFMYLEDADLCKRVNEISEVVYFPGTTVIHKWERGSHKNLKLFKMHMKSMFKYFSKWGFKLK